MQGIPSKIRMLKSELKHFTYQHLQGEYTTENLKKAFEFRIWLNKVRNFLIELYGEYHSAIVDFDRGVEKIEEASNEQEFNEGLKLILKSFEYASVIKDDAQDITPDFFLTKEQKDMIDKFNQLVFDWLEKTEKEVKNMSFKSSWEEWSKSNSKRDKRQLEASMFVGDEDLEFYETDLQKEYFEVTGNKMLILNQKDYDEFFSEMIKKLDTASDNEWKLFIEKYKKKAINKD